jgi:hypothetical protein
MKKIIATVFLGFFVTVFIGCAQTGAGDAKSAEYTHIKTDMTQKEIHKAIFDAAEDAGWRMTEFKDNALIAEKSDGDDTIAVTVSFSKDYFFLSPNNSDLQNIIEDALEK